MFVITVYISWNLNQCLSKNLIVWCDLKVRSYHVQYSDLSDWSITFSMHLNTLYISEKRSGLVLVLQIYLPNRKDERPAGLKFNPSKIFSFSVLCSSGWSGWGTFWRDKFGGQFKCRVKCWGAWRRPNTATAQEEVTEKPNFLHQRADRQLRER